MIASTFFEWHWRLASAYSSLITQHWRDASATQGLLLACLLLGWSSHARAGLVTSEEEAEGGTVTVYRMSVTPAAEPVPALKHRLVLREHKLKRGNAATHYMRAMAENTLRGKWKAVRDKYGEAVDSWYGASVSIDDLPMEDMRDAASAFNRVVEQFVRRGTERRDCDLGFDLADPRSAANGPQRIENLLCFLFLPHELFTMLFLFGHICDHDVNPRNRAVISDIGHKDIIERGLIPTRDITICRAVMDCFATQSTFQLRFCRSISIRSNQFAHLHPTDLIA